MTHILAQRTWTSIGDGSLVLVPTGSTEQHGPYLPLDTDSVSAAAVVSGVADRIRQTTRAGVVLVAPTVPYGASGEHQAFPGTISIGHDSLRAMLIEMVRSLSAWAGRVVFVNAHGGNIQALTRAVTQLLAERHNVAWVPCATPVGDAHAGHTETSLMLHIAPDTVDMARAVKGNPAPIADLLAEVTSAGVRGVSPSGILGDPTGASAVEGEALLEAMVSGVCRRIATADADHRGCLQDPDAPGCGG